MLESFQSVKKSDSGDSCKICWDDFNSVYSLLACGHKFCLDCIGQYLIDLTSTPKDLPAQCSECNTPISLFDIQTILDEASFERLMKASMRHSITFSELKNCPTPNCCQVYKENSELFRCTVCRNSFCKKCRDAPHAGQTCEEAKIALTPEQKKLLGIKSCPRCKRDIQKNMGCSHMTCPCGAHFCWECGKAYNTAAETYTHINSGHQ